MVKDVSKYLKKIKKYGTNLVKKGKVFFDRKKLVKLFKRKDTRMVGLIGAILFLILILFVFFYKDNLFHQGKENITNKLYQQATPKIEQKKFPDVPTEVKIPKLNIRARIISLGLDEKRNMDSPEDPELVGWFKLGFRPGQAGNSVLAGHVDTEAGEDAIFSKLDQLSKDDEIIVKDKNGVYRTFVVEKIEIYNTQDAPLEAIFGESAEKRLNLITCTGNWNEELELYDKRLVVYAKQLSYQ